MKNVRNLQTAPGVEIVQMEVEGMENFTYLIGCTQTREAAIVDPAWETTEILARAAEGGWRITHALVTHHHHDHTNGVPDLVAATDATVIVQAVEVRMLSAPLPNLRPVAPGQGVRIGQLELTCVHAPGHTPGSQCFHLQGTLLSGDTLFINACGRCDLRGSDPEAMYRSLHQVLAVLPGETVLLPGHNYDPAPASTLEQERNQNPYYQVRALDEFLDLRMGRRRQKIL
ncbi:MAG: MBL fold metallo-hydrolase [Candidatus Wallbacteria bacterium]|nr:MBL fold metallo-hydrolase [Candidatus Wallbacteria bacterium]